MFRERWCASLPELELWERWCAFLPGCGWPWLLTHRACPRQRFCGSGGEAVSRTTGYPPPLETRPARPSRRARPNRRKVLQVLMPPNRAHRTGFKVLTAAPGVVRHEPSPNSSSAGLGDIPAGAPAGAVVSPCAESSSRRTTAAGGPHPKPRLTCRDPVDKRSAENRRLTDPAHNSQIRPQLTDPAHAAHPARTRHTLASDR